MNPERPPVTENPDPMIARIGYLVHVGELMEWALLLVLPDICRPQESPSRGQNEAADCFYSSVFTGSLYSARRQRCLKDSVAGMLHPLLRYGLIAAYCSKSRVGINAIIKNLACKNGDCHTDMADLGQGREEISSLQLPSIQD